MRLVPGKIHGLSTLVVFFLLLFGVTISSALSPDPRLLPLVVPGSQLVAGMHAPSIHGQPSSFLLITHNNTVDLADFFAVTGTDQSRSIHQVIFTAAADHDGNLTEHSILVSGHFDRDHILRSANAGTIQYRGVTVLVVSPLERERAVFNDLRWLIVIDSEVALFGTVASVEQELDRYLAPSESDPSIVKRLNRLQKDDDTWCLLSVLGRSNEIRHALGMLDPALAEFVEKGGSFEFGIHYGRLVEFEYEVTSSSSPDAGVVSDSLAKSLSDPNRKSSSLLPRSDIATGMEAVHRVVRVSRSRYDDWLAKLSASARTRSEVTSH